MEKQTQYLCIAQSKNGAFNTLFYGSFELLKLKEINLIRDKNKE